MSTSAIPKIPANTAPSTLKTYTPQEAMSFHNSAQDVTLDGTTLKALLANVEGDWIEAELELDDVLGNSDGRRLPLNSLFCIITFTPLWVN